VVYHYAALYETATGRELWRHPIRLTEQYYGFRGLDVNDTGHIAAMQNHWVYPSDQPAKFVLINPSGDVLVQQEVADGKLGQPSPVEWVASPGQLLLFAGDHSLYLYQVETE
jgi:hypothetical protein